MSVLHNWSRPQTAVSHEGSGAFVFIAADRRADGAVRNVAIERRQVIIERRVAGIAMRIGIAASAYRGVALSLGSTRSGTTFYRVSLVHRDPDLGVELYAARHDRDVVAEWRAWATYFALPKLVEREPGRFETAEIQLGAVAIGHGLKLRRRGAALSKRRPRIRLRRRVPPRRPSRSVKNEREIICYE
jgi:hypothetical protein